jgi:hypothetical protein
MQRREKKVRYQVKVTIEADTKTETLFYSKLAKEMVEQIMGKPKEPITRARKPKITLEKPKGKINGRKKSKKGPITYRSKDLDFSMETVRRKETRKLIRKLAKEKGITTREMATQVSFDDFRKNGLGLVMNHHDNSPYKAVSEAYPKWGILPWDMRYGVRHLWKSRENRAAAMNFVLDKYGLSPNEVMWQHFRAAKLLKLVNKCSLYSLLVDAGYAFSQKEVSMHSRKGIFSDESFYPWQLANAPSKFYQDANNCISATRWLVWKVGKNPQNIGVKDFQENGLGGLLPYYYMDGKGGYKAALREAGFDV